jgi:hypothetical protein
MGKADCAKSCDRDITLAFGHSARPAPGPSEDATLLFQKGLLPRGG